MTPTPPSCRSGLPLGAVNRLEELRGTRVVVWCASDSRPKNLTPADVAEFSRVLQEFPPAPQLDLVLHTDGGVVGAARALALELRQTAPRLAVLVPQKARSAGTLLCLAADELVLGPLAEFSPIDPLLRAGRRPAGAVGPRRISSEDIRCFREMAETWFGLRSEDSRLKVLALLNERFLPTTLGAFFRAEQYMKKVGRELLAHQLPAVSEDERGRIVDRLIAGFGGHQDPICRREILNLGLAARPASEAEAGLLRFIIGACQRFMRSGEAGVRRRHRGLFFGASGGVEYVMGGDPASDAPGSRAGRWVDITPAARMA